MVYCSLTTLRQNDLKKIIAYSSIVHMNFSVLGLFSFNYLAVQASIFSMLAHGLTSSALFFLVGMLYDRSKVRLIIYFGGLTQKMPIYSFFLVFFSFANIAFPGTIGFIGEFLILVGLFEKNGLVLFFSLFGIGFSTIYSI
jgi:NADH-quinone oxidoreductase subunit M